MSTVVENNKGTPTYQYKLNLKTFAVIGAAVLVVIIAAIVALSGPKDKIAGNVYVEHIDLGGKTVEEAQQLLREQDLLQGKAITIANGGKSYTVQGTDIAMTTNVSATAEKALNVTAKGNIFKRAASRMQLKFKQKHIVPVIEVDQEKLGDYLYAFGVQVNGQLKEHEISVEDDTVKIIPGMSGQSSNVDKAKQQVLNSIKQDKFDSINVDLEKEAPKPFNADTLYDAVHREPKDAYYKVEDRTKLVVVPHVVGLEIDKEEAKAKAASVKEGGDPVALNVQKLMPGVTKSMLESKIFTGKLAAYSTRYNASKTNRSENVALAARKINGTILAPGDVFSYNDIVGKRTVANGFKNAPVYENGKSVDGIGGGVCQVSTTLYSAVLYADLEIVSRTNHSLPVSYVPLGQDATVADGSIDFKFKNNTDYPVQIEAGASGGTISITLVGTPVGNKEVKLTHETVSVNENGTTVVSTKKVYENGQLTRTQPLGRSFYKKKEEPTPSPSPSPTPTAQPAAAPPVAAVPPPAEPAPAPEADAQQPAA